MEKVIKNFCTDLSIDEKTIKKFQLSDGKQVASIKIDNLSFKEAEKLHEKRGSSFFKGFNNSVKEWTIWIIETEYSVIDLWETQQNQTFAAHVSRFSMPKVNKPLVFFIQRSAPSSEIGFGMTVISENEIKIEVNRFGRPAVLN